MGGALPPRNGDLGLCISPGPLEGPLLAKARRNLRHGAQKEGCHDRRFQQGTPCASTLGQQVRGVIHKSPGRPCLEVNLHAGERHSCVGSEQSALTEGDACAGQNEPRSRQSRNNVSSEEWTLHPLAVQKIWEIFGRARGKNKKIVFPIQHRNLTQYSFPYLREPRLR